MSEKRGCPECGVSVPPGSPQGLCPRCLMGAAFSATGTYKPPSPTPETGPSPAVPLIDFAEFQRAAIKIALVDAPTIERYAEEASGDVTRLARSLVRAGYLTPYQASAVAQGKGMGLVIGSYLVLDKRGQGGMGVVFKARHRESGKLIALKILLPSFGRDGEAVQRFRREFELAASLNHPNVVAALEATEDRGVQFLTMEYVEGHDLEDMVREVGPLPIKTSLHCAIQAARGLAAAHAQGIVHRDVKPGNLMLDPSGAVRVLDLGLARVMEASNPLGRVAGASLTQSGVYMGTVDFIAPEQANDSKKADHHADIYSLGCTLYFLLTGHPPFEGETILKRLMAHQQQPAPSLHSARDDVPAALEAAYQTMMAKKPGDRPRSMTEVIELLEACRTTPNEAKQARADLKTFAETFMKRASPRKRDRSPDASVFAKRTVPIGLQFDPDLNLEDLVMGYREEAKPRELAEEQLPPKLPRVVRPKGRSRRSPVMLGLGSLALIGLCVAGYSLLPHKQPTAIREPTLAKSTVGPTTPVAVIPAGFRPLFNGKDLADWVSQDGQVSDWDVRDGELVFRGQSPNGYLFTRKHYANFRLRLEFQAPAETNSGVVLGKFDATDNPPDFAEFNISGLDDPREKTGDFFNYKSGPDRRLLTPLSVKMKPVQSWNSMEVARIGSMASVSVNGQKLEYAEELTPVEGPRRIGFQGFKGNIRFRNIEIEELPSDLVTPPPTPIARKPRVLFVDDFSKPQPYWSATTPEELAKEPRQIWGHRNGLYFMQASNDWRGYYYTGALPNGPYSDFSCEAECRVIGDKASSQGSLILQVKPEEGGFEVRIDGNGILLIEPYKSHRDNAPVETPWIGPIRHPAIKPGGAEFNKVRIDVTKRRAEIFVNSVKVCPTLAFDWDLTPAYIYRGVNCKEPTVRAEFDRIEVKALAPPAIQDAETGKQDSEAIRVTRLGGIVLPDGTWVFEGSILKVLEKSGGWTGTQTNMDDFTTGVCSNNRQLLWDPKMARDTLSLEIPLEADGNYEVIGRLTRAKDFGRAKLELNGSPLLKGEPIELFTPNTVVSDFPLGFVTVTKGKTTLKVTMVGKNRASKGYRFGLDEIRFVPVR